MNNYTGGSIMQTTKQISKQISKPMTVGDSAVHGLLNGVAAGLVMAGFVLVVELAMGTPPLAVFGYFDAGNSGSPVVGALTHIAISAIYGVGFGISAIALARLVRSGMTPALWLAAGLVYAALLFGIAEGVILPRTRSPLADLPVWALATAHALYGLVLGWLTGRSREEEVPVARLHNQ
jgi:hypothetical protein